jgi:hypothetical protein
MSDELQMYYRSYDAALDSAPEGWKTKNKQIKLLRNTRSPGYCLPSLLQEILLSEAKKRWSRRALRRGLCYYSLVVYHLSTTKSNLPWLKSIVDS